MIIDSLPSLPSTVTTGDELPVERGTTTYKIDYNALAAAILDKCKTYRSLNVTAGAKFTVNDAASLQVGTLGILRVIATATAAYGNTDAVCTVNAALKPYLTSNEHIVSVNMSYTRAGVITNYAHYAKINANGEVIPWYTTSGGLPGDVLDILIIYPLATI